MRIVALILASFFALSCAFASDVDDLNGPGLALEVHGAPHDLGHYVGTARNPNNFFDYTFYSLASQDPAVQQTFSQMKRHDKIRVWGSLFVQGPQKHIGVTKIVVEENTQGLGEYQRETTFPADYPGPDVPVNVLVHYYNKDARVLVVEYKDAVLPVRLPPTLAMEDLYKNDIVEIMAIVSDHPERPRHLEATSVVRKVAIVDIHGKPIQKTGPIVLFPKSSEVLFDVYALKENLPDGLSRQYTIVNFDDQNLFTAIRNKLASFWQAADQTKVVNGRNKLVNASVVLNVKGKANLQDPTQANPQIIVASLDDIEAFPGEWWAPVDPSQAYSWEILPQAAKDGEVILSKRGELGIFSNFAATPFVLDGKKYASVEGFWQMMKYPDPDMKLDPRARFPWKYTRDQVGQLTGFDAKHAGDFGDGVMGTMKINWVTYKGEQLQYDVQDKGPHYQLIRRAMVAKLEQTPGLKELLLKTGDLKLLPDHNQGPNPPPAWQYYNIWMELRDQLRNSRSLSARVVSGKY